MDRTHQPFPVLIFPNERELLSSWLVRLAEAHVTKVHTFCTFYWPKLSIWNRDIDKLAPAMLLESLSKKSALPLERIIQTTLLGFEGSLFTKLNPMGNTRWITPLGIYHRTRGGFGMQFCPSCLQHDATKPYFRREWRLSLSVVCPTCKVQLLDRCPWCNHPICFFRNDLGNKQWGIAMPLSYCYACKNDLRKAPSLAASQPLVELQMKWYDFIGRGYSDNTAYAHLYFDGLYHILSILSSRRPGLVPLQKAICQEAQLPYVPQEGGQLAAFDKKPVQERTHLLQMLGWLLEEWPERFTAICKQNRTWSSLLLQGVPSLPYWYWEAVMHHLHVVYTSWRSIYPSESTHNSYARLSVTRAARKESIPVE